MTPSIDKLLFTAALGFGSAEERRIFLEFSCRGDEARLKRLEELLEIQSEAEEFFELQPEVEVSPASPADGDEEGSLSARIGPYRLIDRLGAGGCGVVYLAEQLEPVKRKVALKIIRLGMDTENVIARFNMERQSLALMDHPNIARVLDAGTTASGRPYFVMELVDGERITDFCDRSRIALRERLELFILVCEAIQHAHQKGVIHRDIKPSNVLVRKHDGRAVPKVIDFGIAKATAGGIDGDATYTRSGQFVGTPAYMSPEQAEGGVDIDTRSDIYSLGALLCELLSGRPLFSPEQFQDRGVEEIRSILRDEETGTPSQRFRDVSEEELGKIAHHRAADPQRLRSLLAGDLDWIVMKAVEKDRQRRYETANGLAMDVRRYLNEEPVLACPPSRRYLLAKLIRRHRIAFAAVSVALFGLLGGFGVSTWLFLRERDARHEQARLRVQAEHARANEMLLREKTGVADLVTQAAVLVRYQEMEKADALLARLPSGLPPLSLEAADTLKAVADWNVKWGHQQVAAERFSALVPVITSVDMQDTERTSKVLMQAASAIKAWGEPAQYARLRELAIKRFADSANYGVAAQVTKAILLAPADERTMRAIAPMAKILESALKDSLMANDPHIEGWRQFSFALVEFRQGNLDSARYWITRSLASPLAPSRLTAVNHAVMAMVDFKQDQVSEARIALTTARQIVEDCGKWPLDLETWYDWENARILIEEAERMLGVIDD